LGTDPHGNVGRQRVNYSLQLFGLYALERISPQKQMLEKVQHRFTHMFTHLKKLPYEARLEELGLWSLDERRNRADIIEVFKRVKQLSSVPWN